MPFAQAIHETGYFSSARWTQSSNPAGLGATDDGAWGGTFPNPATGILAQYAHLLAYALKSGEGSHVQSILIGLDPRLLPMTKAGYRGISPTWAGLDGRWNSKPTGYPDKVASIAQAVKDYRNG